MTDFPIDHASRTTTADYGPSDAFSFSHTFPSDDDLACAIATIALGFADLIRIHRAMEIADADELSYWFRIGSSAFREAMDVLESLVAIPSVDAWTKGLHEEAQGHLTAALRHYRRQRKPLADLRNASFHYPRVRDGKQPTMANALGRLRGTVSRAPHGGELLKASTPYADLIGNAVMLASLGTGARGFQQFQADVRDGITSYVRFANLALAHFFDSRGVGYRAATEADMEITRAAAKKRRRHRA